jgi:hypothetical protein
VTLAGYEVTQRFYDRSFDGMRETEAYLLERGKTELRNPTSE